MRILVVARENQIIQNLENVLKGIDANIEIVGSTENLKGHLEQVVNENSPDWILINQNDVSKSQQTAANNGVIKARTMLNAYPGKYFFKAFHVKQKESVTSANSNGLNGHDHFSDQENGVNGSEARELTRQLNDSGMYRQRFLVKQGQRFHSIEVNEIAYFFSEGRFIFMKTKDNVKFLFEYRMDELEEIIDPNLFFRVNRSFFVSFEAIEELHVYPGNRLKLYLNPPFEKEVIVSRERMSVFRAWLGE